MILSGMHGLEIHELAESYRVKSSYPKNVLGKFFLHLESEKHRVYSFFTGALVNDHTVPC